MHAAGLNTCALTLRPRALTPFATRCCVCRVRITRRSVDLVLVGAEGVVENGGVINKLGTYQIALAAKCLNKPFYVAAESYKFARLYPLNQQVGCCSTRATPRMQAAIAS